MDEERRRLLDDVDQVVRQSTTWQPDVVARYFGTVGNDDLLSRTPDEFAALMLSHFSVGDVRPVGTDVVHIDPRGTIDLVTDDMPFLVDSVSGDLLRRGHEIALLAHPQFLVQRAPDGQLLAVIDDASEAADAVAESWMHIEVEPLTPEAVAELDDSLRAVLGDVRLAVVDWRAMRDQALNLATELAENPPVGVDPMEVADAEELLTWLARDNFTFVGYREYWLADLDGEQSLVAEPGTALGVMRHERTESTSFAKLSPEAREIALEPHLLVLTKANRRSTIHRTVYLDYIGIKRFDAAGRVVGEYRFLGLYAATAYSQSVTEVPVVRRKVAAVVAEAGLPANSHDGRDLMQFLETYPRDELFEIHVDQLTDVALQVLHLQERRQTRLFLRNDEFGRFASALVYLPRDRYTTTVRERMQGILRAAFGAESVDFSARVSESVLARLHFLVRVAPGRPLPHVDEALLEQQLADATKSWEDDFDDVVSELPDADEVALLLREFTDAFPEAYKEDFPASAALDDVSRLMQLTDDKPMSVHLYEPTDAESAEIGADRRFKVFRLGASMSLSEMLPVLHNLGVGVVDERPYLVRAATRPQGWIYDFGLTLPRGEAPNLETLPERFEEAFRAAWDERLDRDGYAALIVAAGLTWRQVALVQTLMAYGRQLGSTFSQRYCEQVLVGHAAIVRDIVSVLETRLDPDLPGDGPERRAATVDAVASIRERLDAIASLDEDRIVRSLLTIVLAVLRTNYFQRDGQGDSPQVIAVKIEPRQVPEAPAPRPAFEIWVHSPRVSGVHLRFGRVARGGLRWSDRREDFRTEVLGLVKAQMVKNAVIVPVGAKGGFVCSRSIEPSDREAFMAEGIACYQLFVSAMLDVTDNLVEGRVVPPQRVVRLDGDDSYLVVAADKGTATFSDIANAIAAEHGFWLGDAFASGGSAGYDHKAMGITARGAWESVKRHFRELGVNVQTEDFTVAGIGDMSGDVFGNGMLLSEHIQLVAAFDHRHIFLDPNPDSASSYIERKRLFALPRSSWADYDELLISAGGGVYPRTLKSIPISPEVRVCLGLADDVTEMAPNDLLRAILRSPVDLLWNGGIGTYVKSATESNLDVGDKANDAIRVDGAELRCQVVAEGGNLGLTQLGRIEAARVGVRLNTDAIDNSAGVDTSDYEVNIKILLDSAVRDGELAADERTPFLESMTEEVAGLVLEDNYEQNLMLAADRIQSADIVTVHRRLLQDLETRADLDRALEALPAEGELDRRLALGTGLTSPELSVLAAHVKIALTADLLPYDLTQDPWFVRVLDRYFPTAVVEGFRDRMITHPLTNEIITMMMSNDMVNNGGITYPHRATEETGATAIDLARAYLVAIAVFDLPSIWERIDALDDVAPTAVQLELLLESRRVLDRATRWTLQTRGRAVDVDAEIDLFRDEIRRLAPLVPSMLRGGESLRLQKHVERLVDAGAPEDLATDVSLLLDLFSLLDVVEIAHRGGQDAAEVAAIYFAASERYGGDLLLRRITALPRADRWSALARAALRSDLYTALAALTSRITRATAAGLDPQERLDRWEQSQTEGVARARGTLAEITALESSDIATISVALRAIRALVAQGGSAAALVDV